MTVFVVFWIVAEKAEKVPVAPSPRTAELRTPEADGQGREPQPTSLLALLHVILHRLAIIRTATDSRSSAP